jgi:hypothetical protein
MSLDLDREKVHRLIDAAEACAVILKDLDHGWPRQELHISPPEALRTLRVALADLGVETDELVEIFE